MLPDFSRLKHPAWTGVVLPMVLAIGSTFSPDALRVILLVTAVIATTWTFYVTEYGGRKFKKTALVAAGSIIAALAIFAGGHTFDAKAKVIPVKASGNEQQQEKPKQANIQQNSSGLNSPNIVGDRNKVIIYPPVGKPSEKPANPQGFHEVPSDVFLVSLGSVSAEIKMSTLKEGKAATPFKIYGVVPFKLSIGKSGELLFSFVSWSDGVKVEVNNNEVKLGDPQVDRNFSPNAFELVSKSGEPIFQMIRTPSSITVNGIFPTPTISDETGLPIILWISPETGISQNSTKPGTFNLKPIFKYPSWRYPGRTVD
jgi:hypothetical protein